MKKTIMSSEESATMTAIMGVSSEIKKIKKVIYKTKNGDTIH